jgi:hypothetical protein
MSVNLFRQEAIDHQRFRGEVVIAHFYALAQLFIPLWVPPAPIENAVAYIVLIAYTRGLAPEPPYFDRTQLVDPLVEPQCISCELWLRGEDL